MAEVVEHKVLNLLFLAQPPHFLVGMIPLSPVLVEDQAPNTSHTVQRLTGSE